MAPPRLKDQRSNLRLRPLSLELAALAHTVTGCNLIFFKINYYETVWNVNHSPVPVCSYVMSVKHKSETWNFELFRSPFKITVGSNCTISLLTNNVSSTVPSLDTVTCESISSSLIGCSLMNATMASAIIDYWLGGGYRNLISFHYPLIPSFPYTPSSIMLPMLPDSISVMGVTNRGEGERENRRIEGRRQKRRRWKRADGREVVNVRATNVIAIATLFRLPTH